MSSVDNGTNGRQRVPQWAIVAAVLLNTFVVLIISPIAVWSLGRIIEHEKELTAVGATRFTAIDGAAIGSRVSKIEDTLLNGIPPPWFREKVQKVEEIATDTNRRLQRIEIILEQRDKARGATTP